MLTILTLFNLIFLSIHTNFLTRPSTYTNLMEKQLYENQLVKFNVWLFYLYTRIPGIPFAKVVSYLL